jgi:hypothetical protein
MRLIVKSIDLAPRELFTQAQAEQLFGGKTTGIRSCDQVAQHTATLKMSIPIEPAKAVYFRKLISSTVIEAWRTIESVNRFKSISKLRVNQIRLGILIDWSNSVLIQYWRKRLSIKLCNGMEELKYSHNE